MGDWTRKELLQLQEYVTSDNRKRLNEFLECQRGKSSSCETISSKPSLIPSTRRASALLDLFLLRIKVITSAKHSNHDQQEEENTCTPLSACQVFQALLKIDLAYITPWKALCEFSKVAHELPFHPLVECVSSIEEFLMTIPNGFPQEVKSRRDNILPINDDSLAGLMLRFTKGFMDRLFPNCDGGEESHGTKTSQHVENEIFERLISQLLRTVFATTRSIDLHDELFDTIISTLLLQKPPGARTLAWLRLVHASRSLFTIDQVTTTAKILQDQLCGEVASRPPVQDMTSILAIIVDMVIEPLSKEESPQLSALWRELAVYAFYQTVDHQSQYKSAELCLRNCLSRWNSHLVKKWISEFHSIFNGNLALQSSVSVKRKIQPWFAWNLILVCFEALGEKNSSQGRWLEAALINAGTGSNNEICRKVLGTQEEFDTLFRLIFGTEGKVADIFEWIGEIQYFGGGSFRCEGSDKDIDCLSQCGRAFLTSIFLKTRGSNKEEGLDTGPAALDRAIRLVQIADTIMTDSAEESLIQKALVFTTVINVIAYFELPKFRYHFVQKIKSAFGQSNESIAKVLNALTVTIQMIVSSASNVENKNGLLDPFGDIFDEFLPSSELAHLSPFFLCVPKVRSRIFQCSKRLLSSSYLVSSGSVCYDGLPRPESHGADVGLLSLMYLIRGGNWDDAGIDAWRIFSDILVFDMPPIPLSIRQWIYKGLESGIDDGVYCEDVLEHLLRGTVVRLTSYFDAFVEKNVMLTRAAYLQDAPSLHRLVVHLLESLATNGEHLEDRQALLIEGREAFLRSVLACKMNQSSRSSPLEDFVSKRMLTKDDDPDSFMLCWAIFLKLNLKMLHFIGSETSEPFRSTHVDLVWDRLVKDIKSVERSRVCSLQGTDVNQQHYLPTWSTADRFLNIEEKTTSSEFFSLVNSRNSLIGLLLELLYLAPLPAPGDGENPLYWKIVSATGYILSQRTKIPDSMPSNDQDSHFLSLEAINQTAKPFLSVGSLLVRIAILRDYSLGVVEQLLGPILAYCDAFYAAVKDYEESDCTEFVESLWDLYQAVASERASLRIIKYLESHHCDKRKKTAENENTLFILSSSLRENGIDGTVHHIRLRCLLPLQASLQRAIAVEDTDTPNVSQSLLGGILLALVTDLRKGLDGTSGGIASNLYYSYCKSIHECSTLIYDNAICHSFDSAILSLFDEVVGTFSDILVTFPLFDAVLFRTTFLMTVADLPLMRKALLRSNLCDDPSDASRGEKILGVESNLINKTFDDCVQILTRWATLREPFLVPWEDIAGPYYVDRGDHENAKSSLVSLDDSRTSNNDEIPRVVHVPSPPRRKRKPIKDDGPRELTRKITFPTKEIWSGALSCSLIGFEQKWIESFNTVQAIDDVRVCQNQIRIPSEWKAFYSAQKRELQSSLTKIAKLFDSSTDAARGQAILTMLAMNLPSAPRLRLCICIERIAMVLSISIRNVCSFLDDNTKTFFQTVPLVESLCCLSAWLSQDDEDSDFSVGLFKWLAIASRKCPPGDSLSNARKLDTAELVSRITQVSESVYRLFVAFKALQKSVRSNLNKSENAEFYKVSRLFFQSMNENEGGIIHRISLKMRILLKAIPRELQVRSLPDFPSNGNLDASNPTTTSLRRNKKRSRTTENRNSYSKPKKILVGNNKSRNKVVNIFMDLDEGIENSKREGYADLEEFLVEG